MDLVYRGYKEPISKNVLWIKGDELLLYYNGKWEITNLAPVVDNSLSPTSEHAIQNKVVTETFENKTTYMNMVHIEVSGSLFVTAVDDLIENGEEDADPYYYEKLSKVVSDLFKSIPSFKTSLVEFGVGGEYGKIVTCHNNAEERILEFEWNEGGYDKNGFITSIAVAYRYNDDYTDIYPVESNGERDTTINSETKLAVSEVFDKWIYTGDLNSMVHANRNQLLNGMFSQPISISKAQEILEGGYLGICLLADGGNTRKYYKYMGSSRASIGGKLYGDATFEYYNGIQGVKETFTFKLAADGDCESDLLTS